MPAENAQEIGDFLDYFWEREPGRVFVAEQTEGQGFKRHGADWPKNRERLIEWISRAAANGSDVFFSPAMYRPDAVDSTRESVASVNARWVDFDGGAPDDWEIYSKEKHTPAPTVVVQSSVADRQHVYWRTERTTDIDAAQDVNRTLAATFGADKSGWDANQLLRVPGTVNFGYTNRTHATGERKPWFSDSPQPVILRSGSKSRIVGEKEFSNLQSAERSVLERIKVQSIPAIAEVMALGDWTSELYTQFSMSEQEATESSPDKRSGALMKLAYLSAESSLTDEQMYSVLSDTMTRWNKYQERSRAGQDKLIRDLIARSRAKVGYTKIEDLTFAGLSASVAQEIATVDRTAWNYKEFMEAEFKVDWLLEGLIAAGGFGIIVGQPNVGKTTVAMNMAQDIAAGYERVMCWKNTGPQKVMVLSLEMGPNELHHFMGNMAPKYSDSYDRLEKNLHVVPLGSPLYLDRPEGRAFLDNLLAEYRPDILVVDSLQKTVSKPMGDEIAAKALVDYIRKDVRNKYNTAVFMVHHERKRSNDKSGGLAGELSDMYGSQLIAAEVDFVIALRENGNKYVAMDMYKNRLAPKIDTVLYERVANMQLALADHKVATGVVDAFREGINSPQSSPGESGNGRTDLNF